MYPSFDNVFISEITPTLSALFFQEAIMSTAKKNSIKNVAVSIIGFAAALVFTIIVIF